MLLPQAPEYDVSAWKCDRCGVVDRLSPTIKAVQVWMSKLGPNHECTFLLPEDDADYRICMACGGHPVATFVEAAVKSHAVSANGWWVRAFLHFDDGTRVQITQDDHRPTQAKASA